MADEHDEATDERARQHQEWVRAAIAEKEAELGRALTPEEEERLRLLMLPLAAFETARALNRGRSEGNGHGDHPGGAAP